MGRFVITEHLKDDSQDADDNENGVTSEYEFFKFFLIYFVEHIFY